MRSKIKLLFFLISFCLYFNVGAIGDLSSKQELSVSNGKALSLENAIQISLQNNPDLAAAKQSLQKAQIDYKSAYTAFFPSISASVDFTASDSNISSSSALDTSSDRGVQHVVSVGPRLQQNIFSGFKDVSTLRKLKANFQSAQAAYQLKLAQLSYDLKTSFYKLLYAQDLLKLTQSIVPRREQNLKLVQLRYQVGRENKGSELRSQAQLDQAHFEVSQAQQNLEVAQAALQKILGEKPLGKTMVQGSFKLPLSNKQKIVRFDELTQQNPQYLQAKAQEEAGEQSVKVAKSSLYPSLDANAAFSRVRNDDQQAYSRWSAGVSLSYPFFNSGKSIYDIKSAKAEYQSLKNTLKSTENEILYTLKKTHSDLLNAEDAAKVQKSFLEAAQVRAEIARNQYSNGLVSFQDWDSIENDLINTQKNTLSSLNNVLQAQSSWEQAQGKGILFHEKP